MTELQFHDRNINFTLCILFLSGLHPGLLVQNSISNQMCLFCRIGDCLQWQFLPREQGSTWQKWMLETIWVYREKRVAQPPWSLNYSWMGDTDIYFVYEMTHSAVQITGVNTQAREGINILDQIYHCCDWSWHPVHGWEHLKDLQSFPVELLLFAFGLSISI